MPSLDKTDKKISPPVYLFKRLGQYIGVSTEKGDFYNLSPEAYHALSRWNNALNTINQSLSEEIAGELARKCFVPPDISNLFPLRGEKDLSWEDRDVSSYITDLTLNITSRCNLRCIYCWNDQGKYSNTDFEQSSSSVKSGDQEESDMSLDTARKAVDLLLKSCGDEKQLVVDFYGGEPLEKVEVLKAIVGYCRQKEKEHDVSFHFLLATNGTLLKPSVAKDLIDSGVQIAVSIDGPKNIHDNNRPYENRKGSFDAIAENLKNMPDHVKKRLVGRTTVTPFFSDMVALYENLRNLGFERVELFESEDACHKITPQREGVFFRTDQEYQKLFKEYERLALLYIDEVAEGFLDYRKTFFNRFFKLMQKLYYNHEVSGGCPAAKGQIAVSGDGNIYPCTSFLGVERFNLGNVHKGIDKVKYNAFIKTINRRFDFCRDCDLFSVCRTTGSCLNMNYYFNSDLAIPYQRSCELFTEKLKLAMAALAILAEKIPDRLEELFGFDPVGSRGNKLY